MHDTVGASTDEYRGTLETMIEIEPRVLSGVVVDVEPLGHHLAVELYELGRDPEIWNYMPDLPIDSVDEANARIDRELKVGIPFAIRIKSTGELAGCLSYRAIELLNESVEIAWVWVASRHRGKLVAAEAHTFTLRYSETTIRTTPTHVGCGAATSGCIARKRLPQSYRISTDDS